MKTFRCSILCFYKLPWLIWKERETSTRETSNLFYYSSSIHKWPLCSGFCAAVFQWGLGPPALPLRSQVLIWRQVHESAKELPSPSQTHEFYLVTDDWQRTSGSCRGLHWSSFANFKWMRSIGGAWLTALHQSERSPELVCKFLHRDLILFHLSSSVHLKGISQGLFSFPWQQ